MFSSFGNYEKLNVHEQYLYTTLTPVICMKLHYEHGVPASIQLAQAIAESGGGISEVAKNSNNHFGIKAFSNWKGKVYTTKYGTHYRAYTTLEEGYKDHAEFLNYHYKGAVGKNWRYWVANCKGYGASSNYWQHIGKIIEIYKLYKFDVIN
jgi:flagellum-specific peptidoglycan hydrolase FlgJ